MTKNSLFTQFRRLSGMRPGVGEKGESVSASSPSNELQCLKFHCVCPCKGWEEKTSHIPCFRRMFWLSWVQGWRIVSHPHSQHLASRGAVPSRVTFRTREPLSWNIVPTTLEFHFGMQCCVCTTVWVSTSNRGSNYCFPLLFFPATDTSICPFINKIRPRQNLSASHN